MDNTTTTTCLSGAQPIPLASFASCQDGFYCPSNDQQHQLMYCPPSPDCLLTRLQNSPNLCTTLQGPLEPTICMPGFYCPPGGKQQLECPRGYFCPLGAVAPRRCAAMSICAPGSSHATPLLGLFLCLLLDLTMIGTCVFLRASLPSSKLQRYLRGIHRRSRSQPAVDDSANDKLEEDMQQLRGDFPGETTGNFPGFRLELSFRGIHLHPRHSRREILSGLEGRVHSGSVLGIIGASGSGKCIVASFVNVLSGRIQPTEGCISLNGRKSRPEELRDLIGFIPQHDIVLPDLTVRENILYSGRVLLSGQHPDHTIQQHVDFLISSLGLQPIQNQWVGGLLHHGGRGISGGEYKRVSIALALAAKPMALVLDEPTSGLDATAAHSLMKLLHAISRQGIMVVCVIHQPRVEIFHLLDDLLVLDRGAQVYHGRAAAAQLFFEMRGHRFPAASNPADVILDVLLHRSWGHGEERGEEEHTSPSPRADGDDIRETAALVALFQTIRCMRASWPRQLWLAFGRSIVQQSRQTTGLALEIVSAAVIGVMIGLAGFESRGRFFQGVYHDPFDLLSSAVEYRMVAEQGLLCCLAIACAAGPAAVKIFGEEKATFYRECQAGHSRSAYFLGKNLAVSFRIVVASLHFTAFYMVLATPLIPFRLLFGLGCLYFYCIYGLGFVVSAVTRREDGPLLCMLLSLIISALSGCAPRLSTVRSWHLAWFWYAWPATWFSEAFYQENTAPLAYLYDIEDAARFTGFTLGRTGMDIGFLVLIGTLYRALSYLLFVFWGWKSQR
ncbi:hypothetical protein FE257_005597 [Aspergillus nanangensis]|uniref:ABC transporter domain-containing protein n=1 Tax=Aspergillus nanangensis TaxID=2582783 RepID=A0AAD4CQC7_ASPNN|nr:hypothetical protein FE257_005597 [Aspergillus nanangensis]